ncbi:hypothetical protein GCM10011289_31010 [Paludibacterium paludis]|uniref:Uncharacterized protein n=1 Tax=Paludibacterium paludis TaxID=1225769 RepID=A0A918UAW2_9NEIS|nr:hypothetical protein GCM10011289_31010 [Paludibacterium paludis]
MRRSVVDARHFVRTGHGEDDAPGKGGRVPDRKSRQDRSTDIRAQAVAVAASFVSRAGRTRSTGIAAVIEIGMRGIGHVRGRRSAMRRNMPLAPPREQRERGKDNHAHQTDKRIHGGSLP